MQTNRRNPHRRTGTDATQARSTSDLSSSALTSRGVGLTRSRLTHRHRPRLDPRPNIFVRRIAHACGHVCRSDIYALILCISSSHICLKKRWFPQETLYTVNLHELLLYNRLSPFFFFFHSTPAMNLPRRPKPPEEPRSWDTRHTGSTDSHSRHKELSSLLTRHAVEGPLTAHNQRRWRQRRRRRRFIHAPP